MIRYGFVANAVVVDGKAVVVVVGVGDEVVLTEVVAEGVESDRAAGDERAIVVDAVDEDAVNADVMVDDVVVVVEIGAVDVVDGS